MAMSKHSQPCYQYRAAFNYANMIYIRKLREFISSDMVLISDIMTYEWFYVAHGECYTVILIPNE